MDSDNEAEDVVRQMNNLTIVRLLSGDRNRAALGMFGMVQQENEKYVDAVRRHLRVVRETWWQYLKDIGSTNKYLRVCPPSGVLLRGRNLPVCGDRLFCPFCHVRRMTRSFSKVEKYLFGDFTTKVAARDVTVMFTSYTHDVTAASWASVPTAAPGDNRAFTAAVCTIRDVAACKTSRRREDVPDMLGKIMHQTIGVLATKIEDSEEVVVGLPHLSRTCIVILRKGTRPEFDHRSLLSVSIKDGPSRAWLVEQFVRRLSFLRGILWTSREQHDIIKEQFRSVRMTLQSGCLYGEETI